MFFVGELLGIGVGFLCAFAAPRLAAAHPELRAFGHGACGHRGIDLGFETRGRTGRYAPCHILFVGVLVALHFRLVEQFDDIAVNVFHRAARHVAVAGFADRLLTYGDRAECADQLEIAPCLQEFQFAEDRGFQARLDIGHLIDHVGRVIAAVNQLVKPCPHAVDVAVVLEVAGAERAECPAGSREVIFVVKPYHREGISVEQRAEMAVTADQPLGSPGVRILDVVGLGEIVSLLLKPILAGTEARREEHARGAGQQDILDFIRFHCVSVFTVRKSASGRTNRRGCWGTSRDRRPDGSRRCRKRSHRDRTSCNP